MFGTSKDIKYPGLNILPPGVERHVVNGGALTAFQIFPDDELEIINNEGKQVCEIIAFNINGKPDLSILDLKENANGDFSKRTITKDEKISKIFQKKNLELNKDKSSILFNKFSEYDLL